MGRAWEKEREKTGREVKVKREEKGKFWRKRGMKLEEVEKGKEGDREWLNKVLKNKEDQKKKWKRIRV